MAGFFCCCEIFCIFGENEYQYKIKKSEKSTVLKSKLKKIKDK